MKLRTYTGLIAASAMALTLAACGKKAEEATPAADTAVTPPADSMAATPPADAMTATPPATGSMATTPPADSMSATLSAAHGARSHQIAGAAKADCWMPGAAEPEHGPQGRRDR